MRGGPTVATFEATRPDAGPALDAAAAARAMRRISAEITLPGVVDAVARVALECSGARRAALILPTEAGLTTHARAAVGPGGVEVTAAACPAQGDALPVAILEHVARTGARVCLDGADPRAVAADPYVARARPRSLLALPLARQAWVSGVLYLEDDAADVFTPERLDLLELIAAQAAISLDHALVHRGVEDALRARDEFISIASHELRTPLTPLKLQLQVLKKVLDEQSAEAAVLDRVALALRQIERLGRLVDNLLDVALVTRGRLEVTPQAMDLVELAREVAARFADDLRNADATLEIAAGEPVLGCWDRERLEQALTNLLSNAVRFGAGAPIDLAVERDGGFARVTVRDRGLGIAPEAQERIFDRFERAACPRAYGGLGLGLFITRQIAEAHGGVIRVESRPGAGATFCLELPLDPNRPSHTRPIGARGP